MSRPKIRFNHNWNGKLYCYAFTTLRLRSDSKYKVNQEYDLELKGYPHETVTIAYIHHFPNIDAIAEIYWLLDTGLNKQEAVNEFKYLYRNIVTNWETQQISLLCLRRIRLDASQTEKPPVLTYKAKPNKAA